MTASVLASIAAFALLLTLLVYVTGNLGAAFGAHLGNNLTGFLLISHQQSYNSFALFTAKPLESPDLTSTRRGPSSPRSAWPARVLTILLLLHPRSPLKVEPEWPGQGVDAHHAGGDGGPSPPGVMAGPSARSSGWPASLPALAIASC